MPIILPCQLSCFEALKTELPTLVWAEEEMSAQKALEDKQAMLRIGVINLMPTKEATERQWARLLAKQPQWIVPQWVQMGSYESKNTEQSYLDKYYTTSEALNLTELDGIILTGAPVEHLEFEEVAYWEELRTFLEKVKLLHIPILAVCWGAQSLLYQRHGVPKKALGQKCFGIFNHSVLDHRLKGELGKNIAIPHSRHTTWDREDLMAKPLKVLIDSEEAGVFALEDERGDWYFTGHAEYEAQTLVLEYERDLEKGQPIEVPKGIKKDDKGQWVSEATWHEEAKVLVGAWTRRLHSRIGA